MGTKLYSHIFGVINGSEFSAYGIGIWNRNTSSSRYTFSKLPKEFPLTPFKTCECLHHPFLNSFTTGRSNQLRQILDKGGVFTLEGIISFPEYESRLNINAVISSPKPGIQVISQTFHGYYEGPCEVTFLPNSKQVFAQGSQGLVSSIHVDNLSSKEGGTLHCKNEFELKVPMFSSINKFYIDYELVDATVTGFNMDVSLKSNSFTKLI